ncbi:hypothetical protein DL96DRAFT_1721903 [Flagelloscypha sp. PMI_526]|nr:hypothetical protein DL96DRAFT_1721903 [Flagelloscypha sp. PMI_526]
MPNPFGKNGSGVKEYPPENELVPFLMSMAGRKTQDEKVHALKEHFNLTVSVSHLRKMEREREIPSVRRLPPSLETVTEEIHQLMRLDLAKNNGPDYIKIQLLRRGLIVPVDRITRIMKTIDPDGFIHRFPSKKPKYRIHRTPLVSIGPFHEIHIDGHEKLERKALRMGSVSLPIYGWRDKFSGDIVKMDVVPDCRSLGAVAYLFLDFLDQYKAIPVQFTADKGTETGLLHAIQANLRQLFASNIDMILHPPMRNLSSTQNTPIEGCWLWLRQKKGHSQKRFIREGYERGVFNSDKVTHCHLFHWIFPPLVQHDLNDFQEEWRMHKIRTQGEKLMPSGHRPGDAMENPGQYGGCDCRIPVSQDVIDELRLFVSEIMGPREQFLSWFPAAFDDMAKDVYEHIGSPPITWENSWSIFEKMATQLDLLYIE